MLAILDAAIITPFLLLALRMLGGCLPELLFSAVPMPLLSVGAFGMLRSVLCSEAIPDFLGIGLVGSFPILLSLLLVAAVLLEARPILFGWPLLRRLVSMPVR